MHIHANETSVWYIVKAKVVSFGLTNINDYSLLLVIRIMMIHYLLGNIV